MVHKRDKRLLNIINSILLVITTANASTPPLQNSIISSDILPPDGPLITPNESEIILEYGQNFTITCQGQNGVNFKQQEPDLESGGKFFISNITIDEYSKAIVLNNVDESAVGFYACFDDTVDSDTVLKDVTKEPINDDHITYIYVYVNGSQSLLAPNSIFAIAIDSSKYLFKCRPTSPEIDITLEPDTIIINSWTFDPKLGYVVSLHGVGNSLSYYATCFARYNDINDSVAIIVQEKSIKCIEAENAPLLSQYNRNTNIILIGQKQSQSDEKIEYLYSSKKVGFVVTSCQQYSCKGRHGTQNSEIKITCRDKPPPKPEITASPNIKYYLPGETFILNCSIIYQANSAVNLDWTLPGNAQQDAVIHESNEDRVKNGELYYHSITVVNASEGNHGTYVCEAKKMKTTRTMFLKEFLETPFVNASTAVKNPVNYGGKEYSIRLFNVVSYPPANLSLYKNGENMIIDGRKYWRSNAGNAITLRIKELHVNDTANYTLILSNNFAKKEINLDLRIKSAPEVICDTESDKKIMVGQIVSLGCKVIGYPLPKVTWTAKDLYTDEPQYLAGNTTTIDVETPYKLYTIINYPVKYSSHITCTAQNSLKTASSTIRVLGHEIYEGFGIVSPERNWFAEYQTVEIECYASVYDYTGLKWVGDGDLDDKVTNTNSTLSHIATLTFDHIDVAQSGNYTCVATDNNGQEVKESFYVSVKKTQMPNIIEPEMDSEMKVLPFQTTQLSCLAEAIPEPRITWYKDGQPIEYGDPDSKFDIIEDKNDSILNSTIVIYQIQEQHEGSFECRAESGDQTVSRLYHIHIENKASFKYEYLSIIIVVFVLLLLLVAYLFWKIKKEKRFRKELAAAGLLNFKEGLPTSINPDLGITEQALNLPYDSKFEFPPDKLKLGRQLGAGAFGVVYKAEARGIVNAEQTTTVAVKMVKRTAENMHIMALASELKIMVHLGKHINIVNLLGACTNNVGKRELLVIVEYCKYGNIHNYLQKHREVFVDQLTDTKAHKFGKTNRGFSYSVGSSGVHSDYFGSDQTQNTENTFLNTGNSNRSSRKLSESCYVQPEWRSNYEGDYVDEGRSPRPLFSRDLICWAFQIARGMEYLAERKVLHGDLAARNILLADDNVVKICDFGLARSIYMNDEYQKKEHSLLPVKWLAIECLTDRIFSTQSDVWAFGIVLWELFSLAKTPYPNIGPNHLLQWLSDGNRLDKPAHADDRLYELMLQCWQQKPTCRPSFSQLQNTLGTFLEESVREHYVDLNAVYMDLNAEKQQSGQEDYLAMMCSPDYNDQISPDGHHYTNEPGSFTVALPQDADGYLQMTPSRSTPSKFDFDVRKLNQYPSYDGNPEMTPMLTLHNLPRSGSESDHEDITLPQHLNTCPKIDEEDIDEIFENVENQAKDIKNTVTNPTYLKLEDEKKLENGKKINYINVSDVNKDGNVYINVNTKGLVMK